MPGLPDIARELRPAGLRRGGKLDTELPANLIERLVQFVAFPPQMKKPRLDRVEQFAEIFLCSGGIGRGFHVCFIVAVPMGSEQP
jgi:hypothetical protein